MIVAHFPPSVYDIYYNIYINIPVSTIEAIGQCMEFEGKTWIREARMNNAFFLFPRHNRLTIDKLYNLLPVLFYRDIKY